MTCLALMAMQNRHAKGRKLPSASVIVLDNAAFHKRNDLRLLFSLSEHTLKFLPPYSPDLNPIEQ